MLPILLLVSYPIVLIPIIIWLLCKDIAVKGEGVLTWHRDSLGILMQRLFICILILTCIVIFENCAVEPTVPNG